MYKKIIQQEMMKEWPTADEPVARKEEGKARIQEKKEKKHKSAW